MTKSTIISLFESEPNVSFNVILVESNSTTDFKYDIPNVTYVKLLSDKFNYNKSLNFGLKYSKNHWVLILNNDIYFEKGWLSNIINTNEFKNIPLSSFSPFDPKIQSRNNYPYINDINLTYRTIFGVTGWCILTNKLVIDKIGGSFDERFEFWYQDDDYSKTLKTLGIPHFLVKNSIAHHLSEQSHVLIKNRIEEYTTKPLQEYLDKWGEYDLYE
jgi:GT2 family glycosyltransferase